MKSSGRLNLVLLIILAILVLTLIGSSINTLDPSSSLYSLKRVTENIRLIIASSDSNSKANVLTDNLDSRLNEIKFLVDSNNLDPLEKASNRYNSTAGQLLDLFPSLNKDEISKIKTQIKNHPQTLTDIRAKFGTESAYSLIIPQNIDTANRLLGY